MNLDVTLEAGAVLGFALNWAAVWYLLRRVRALRAAAKGAARPETMKRFVWACVANGFAWVWFSYILAYLDKPQIAEELSKVALVEIIVPVAVYALKSGVENLSKNNRWPDRDGGEAPAEGEPEDREEETYDC